MEEERQPQSARRILVVDDEPIVRRIFERLLGRDHEVTAVASAEQAKALLSGGTTFDVIFCDLLMPAVTGMDLFHWLHGERPTQAQRMVFISGGFDAGGEEFLSQIDNARLYKPFLRAEVLAVVASVTAA